VLFLAIGLPLALVGFVLTVATTALGVALSVTFIGLPSLVAGGLLAVRIGTVNRRLAARLLGRMVPAAPARPSRGGLWGWLQARLLEPRAWRARLYLLAKLPIAFAGLYATAVLYVEGALGVVYVVARPLSGPAHAPAVSHSALLDLGYTIDRGSDTRPPLHLQHWWTVHLGHVYFDTWPLSLAVAAGGIVALLIAPWAARGAARLDVLLMTKLLGPSAGELTVERLERARGVVADDAATTLRRIERDLHDGTQAQLVALAMNLGELKEHLDVDATGDPTTLELVGAAHGHAKEALDELRNIARGIHPPSLDLGLDHALATLAARSVVPAVLDARLPSRPAQAIETIAYYSAAELLTNVAKHSGAHRADLVVTEQGERLILSVADDGCGGADPTGGTGLLGLTKRLEAVDGSLRIDSPPGGPTTVTVDLPLRL
jgi:signal transduction histidine kinase